MKGSAALKLPSMSMKPVGAAAARSVTSPFCRSVWPAVKVAAVAPAKALSTARCFSAAPVALTLPSTMSAPVADSSTRRWPSGDIVAVIPVRPARLLIVSRSVAKCAEALAMSISIGVAFVP